MCLWSRAGEFFFSFSAVDLWILILSISSCACFLYHSMPKKFEKKWGEKKAVCIAMIDDPDKIDEIIVDCIIIIFLYIR